jgi:hypothetical protein
MSFGEKKNMDVNMEDVVQSFRTDSRAMTKVSQGKNRALK